MHRRTITQLIVVPILVCLCSVAAHADDVSVSATVEPQHIALGDSVELRVAINGTQEATAPPITMDGCLVHYLGPSTYISIVNGRVSSSITYIYSLLPQKTGTFTIDAIPVQAGGRALRTEPVTFEVLSASARPQRAPTNLPQEEAAEQPQGLGDAIKLQLGVDKARVYQNQPIQIRLQLLVGGVAVRGIEMPTLQADGFLVKPLGQPAQSDVAIGGQPYTLLQFDTVVTPTRAGTLAIGPATLNCQVAARRRRQPHRRSASPFDNDPFGEFFDHQAFFEDFFNQVQLYPMTVRADPVQVEVLPLPEQGKPSDFSGAVGRFTLEHRAVPSEAAVGEPITLTMTVRGDGNLDTVAPPRLVGDTSHFKVYEPQTRKDSAAGQKVFEQVLMPLDASVRELPAPQFSSFDPDAGQYHTLRQAPIAVRVKPAAKPERATVIEHTAPTAVPVREPERLGRDIVYIKEELGALQPAGRRWYGSPWWIMWYGVPMLWLGASEIARRYRARRMADPGIARASGAMKHAWAQLQTARRHTERGQMHDGYADIFRAMQRYVGDRFNLSTDGLTRAEIESVLRARGASEALVRDVAALCDRCDAARFAPASIAADHAEATWQLAATALKQLEHWRSR